MVSRKQAAEPSQTARALRLKRNRSTPMIAPAIQLPTSMVTADDNGRPLFCADAAIKLPRPPPSSSMPMPTSTAISMMTGATGTARRSSPFIPDMEVAVNSRPLRTHAANTSSVIGAMG
ncbi:hypothetical protein D3C72_1787060 [compost metagenome]